MFIDLGSHISLSWFSCGSSILVELEFGDVGFCGGRKTGKPGEKPSEQGENNQQTQPTCGTRPESNSDHIGGRRALSPLLLPCSLVTSVVWQCGDQKSKFECSTGVHITVIIRWIRIYNKQWKTKISQTLTPLF